MAVICLTLGKRREIERLYNDDMRPSEIAAAVGVSLLLKRLKDHPITLHSAAWGNINPTITPLNGTHGAAAQLPTFYPSRSIWGIR